MQNNHQTERNYRMTIKTELTAVQKKLTTTKLKVDKLIAAVEKSETKPTKAPKAKAVKAKSVKKAPKAEVLSAFKLKIPIILKIFWFYFKIYICVRSNTEKRDLLLKENIFTTFQAELVRAQIESQDVTRRFQVIEPPEVPLVKAAPSRGMISIIVTIAAFFLSVFTAFMVEYFSRAKTDPLESQKIELIKDQFRIRKQLS